MPAGSGLTIPRLDGESVEQQLWQGAQAAASLARTFVETGVGDADDWIPAKRKPFEFLKRSLRRWLDKHDEPVIRE